MVPEAKTLEFCSCAPLKENNIVEVTTYRLFWSTSNWHYFHAALKINKNICQKNNIRIIGRQELLIRQWKCFKYENTPTANQTRKRKLFERYVKMT